MFVPRLKYIKSDIAGPIPYQGQEHLEYSSGFSVNPINSELILGSFDGLSSPTLRLIGNGTTLPNFSSILFENSTSLKKYSFSYDGNSISIKYLGAGGGNFEINENGQVFIGLSSNTTNSSAILNLSASTSSFASINFYQGIDPSSPTNGDFWYDGSRLKLQTSSIAESIAYLSDLGSTSNWKLDGNNETTEKFIGTLNSFDLPIRINNVELARFTTTSKLYLKSFSFPSDITFGVGGAIQSDGWRSKGTNRIKYGSNDIQLSDARPAIEFEDSTNARNFVIGTLDNNRFGVYSDQFGDWSWVTNNLGHFGLGINNPLYKFHVVSDSLITGQQIIAYFNNNQTTGIIAESGGGASSSYFRATNTVANNYAELNANANYAWVYIRSNNGGVLGFYDATQLNLRLSSANSTSQYLQYRNELLFSDIDGNIFSKFTNNGSFALGGNFTPHASSILEISSTTKGILFPRMTTAQRNSISSPAIALTIYNTDTNQYNYWNGSIWTIIGGAGGTVTSVDVSGGTTGLSFSGGPIISAGLITMSGVLNNVNGGTGTSTQFTQGSIVFAGVGGTYTQDNTNLYWDNLNNRLGIRTNSPLTTAHIAGDTTIESVSGVFTQIISATTTTTNASTTTLQTISIPTNTVVMIEARVHSRKTSGAGSGNVGDGNGYIRVVKAKNVAGVVTIGSIQTPFTSEDIAAFNATFAISGTNVLLQVVGSANNNVTWTSSCIITR